MVITQRRSKRKPTGGRYKARASRRRLHEKGNQPSLTKLDSEKNKTVKTMGGNRKTKLMATKTAYVINPATNKLEKAAIETIKEAPANRHFIRRNIMTKGALIETDKGLARITSRPGQSGAVQAVLVK